MPPHLKLHSNGYFRLIDGHRRKSLKTKDKQIATELLERYARLRHRASQGEDGQQNWAEKTMVDRVAAELQIEGDLVSLEHRLRFGRKVDLVAFREVQHWNPRELRTESRLGQAAFIIEAKVTHALAGVGQLLADRIELQSQAPLILLVRSDCYSQVLQKVCDQVGIEIWVDKVRGKKVIPLIGS